MKKILTLFIAFFVFFSASANLYSVCIDNISLSDFDDYALEQVQKIFSSNLSKDTCQEKQSKENTKNTKSDFEICFGYSNDVCCLNQNVSFKNIFTNNVCYKHNNFVLQFYENKTIFPELRGLSEYKINLNAYMAITVPDNKLNIIYKNILC